MSKKEVEAYNRGYAQGCIQGRVDASAMKENADGCKDCAFENTEEWEMPCAKCKRNMKDYWRAKKKRGGKEMSKSILIIDMPSVCIDCPCHFAGMGTVVCGVKKKELLADDIETFKPDWCPLKEIPQRANHIDYCDNGRFDKGWNACIDEILKEHN